MNLSGTKTRFARICSVRTVQSFAMSCGNNPSLLSKEVLFIPQLINRKGDNAFITVFSSIKIDEKGYIITSTTEDLFYLEFLVNSVVGRSSLFDGHINTLSKTKVSQKRIAELMYWRLDQDTSDIYAIFERFASLSFWVFMKNISDHGLEQSDQDRFHYMVFSEIRDALSLELALYPLFEKEGVYVARYCQEIIASIDNSDKTPYLTFINKVQSNESPLRNNLKKMVMVIKDIDRHIRETQEDYGVENK